MISIIVPVYNAERFLKKCFDSIIAQTYTNFEVIIINDGSTDRSLEICYYYSTIDKRFKVFSQQNKGASSARNLGIEKANGKWLCFIDSDDYVKKNYLKFMHDNIQQSSFVLLNKDLRSRIVQDFDIIKLIIDNFIQLNTFNKLYDTRLIRKHNITFPIQVTNGEDFCFACNYLTYAKQLIVVNANEYCYNKNENSISNKKQSYENELNDYEAMRQSWIKLIKSKNNKENLSKLIWSSPVRTRFEHLLYAILRTNNSLFLKYKLMQQHRLEIYYYSLYYPGKVKRKILAMYLLKKHLFFTYLLYNKVLLCINKNFA